MPSAILRDVDLSPDYHTMRVKDFFNGLIGVGGAQNGPLIWLEPGDHNALHNYMRDNDAWFRKDAEAFVKLDRKERYEVIEGGLITAGVDTTHPDVRDRINKSLDMTTGDNKAKTKGGRGKGTKMADPPRFRPANKKIAVNRKTRKVNKKQFRKKTARRRGRGSRGSGGVGAAGGRGALLSGASIVLGVYSGDAAGRYEELLDLSFSVDARREGPSLIDEIDALSIISDLNVSLGGNAITIYGGWNYWREIHGATAGGDGNFWWAR